MKKNYRYNEVSDKLCIEPECTKKLKLNLLDKNPDAKRCYKHHIKQSGNEGRREYYK
jgi:hypothetical protein